MSASISVQIVNGLSGDPAAFVYLTQLGEAVLFDAGELGRLSNRDLLKIKTVCISHTHIDHFIGFDLLLRVNVPHFRTLEVVGPRGITKNVCGKIDAYTWNLLEPGQVKFIVHEVSDGQTIESFRVQNDNGFVPEKLSEVSGTDSVPLSHSRYRIATKVLDHGTPVCSYSLTLPDTLAVSKEALNALGVEPGSWIGDLQRKASEGDLSGDTLTADGSIMKTSDLAAKILSRKIGEKISYVTDVVFSRDNLSKLSALMHQSDLVICETNYREEHRDRAFAVKHLTTKQAALITASTSSKKLRIFHVSNIYGDSPEASEAESESYFKQFTALSDVELENVVETELKG